ncbi:LysE family translocator [Streptomyces albus]|uniref:LysE family translocator n=1 Tax=Streptomyces albus TaxID=1888 RepID=UPI0024AC91F1|nr:LysE family translocator [Streptomyces albus]MDI6410444.1 LysE family translocator [Streptomyces albus]
MTTSTLLAFAGLCLLVSMTPGPDTFLVLRYSLSGSRPGIAVAVGSGLGSMLWALAVALGVSALLHDAGMAFLLVKVAGGLYLLCLGLQGLRRTSDTTPDAHSEAPGVRAGLRAGLVSCLLNPKVGLFFLAVVPQFLTADAAGFGSVMALGAIDAVVAVIWLAAVAVGAARAMAWLKRPRVARALEVVSSSFLALVGVGTLATAAREGT